jgi:iron complex outermembrane recepter protein
MCAPVFGRAVARTLCLSTSVTSILCLAAAPRAYAQQEPTMLPPVQIEPSTPAKPAAKPRTAAGPKTAARRRIRNQGGQANPHPDVAAQTSGGQGGQSQDPAAYSASDAGTGTKTNSPIMTTPLNVQVVPQQVLQDQQVTSIDQAVKNVSGITTGGGGPADNGQPYSSIFIRGFHSDSIFLDGTRLDSYGGDSNLFAQQFANVDKLEVLKGPAAILYGAVEPGGIVNIVTRQPQSQPAYSMQEQIGSFGLSRTTLNATGPVTQDGSVLYRLDTSYENGGSQTDFVSNRTFFIAPVVQWNIDPSDQVKVAYTYRSFEYGQNYGFLPTLNGVVINNNPHLNYGASSPLTETTNQVALTWTHKFDNDWSFKQRILYNDISSDGAGILANNIVPNTFGVTPNPSGLVVARGINNVVGDDQNINVTTDLTGPLNTFGLAHTLLFGNEYARYTSSSHINQACELDTNCSYVDLFNPINPGTPFTGSTTVFNRFAQLTEQVGLYAQDQLKLPAGFFLLAGARWQWLHETSDVDVPSFGLVSDSAVTATALTPRAGLLWQPRDWLSVYSSYTTSFGPAAAGDIQENGQNVPPTSGRQWEAGLKFALLGGKLTATAAYFDLTKTNIPTADINNPNFVTVTGEAKSRGVEFDLQGELAPGWKVIANYAHTDARVAVAGPLDVAPVGSPLGSVPYDLAHLWTTYSFQNGALRGLTVGGGTTYTGVTPYTAFSSYTGQAIPSHTVFDLMAAYKFEAFGQKWTAQINANNIFNRVYLSEAELTAPVPSPTAPYSWINGIYGPLRTVIASLRVEW